MNAKIIFLIISFNQWASVNGASNPPITQISSGIIRGRNIINAGLAFQGIPYAAKPQGNNRFMPPEPVPKWTSVLNTSKYPSICPQYSGSNMIGEEDCLYLNVFTPNVNTTQRWPVFVWIHGGGFETGSGTRFTPDSIMKQFVTNGIVVVTINYRLNSLGYFTTNSTEITANLGMLDQVAALNWIQNEIASFGGDKTRVTIGGESAGSASVSLHTHSPMSKGIFSQAVMESGAWRNPWALSSVPIADLSSTSAMFAIASGCVSSADWKSKLFNGLRACLQNMTLSKLMKVTKSIPLSNFWNPIIGDKFLPLPPYLFPVDPAVKFLMGSNRNEWAFETTLFRSNMSLINAYNASTFEQSLNFDINKLQLGPGYKVIQDLSRHKYAGYTGFDGSHASWYWARTNIRSDLFMNAGVVGEAKYLQQNNNSVHLYSFDYASPKYWGNDTVTSVTHFTEVLYLFPGLALDDPIFDYTFDAQDTKISNMLGSYWSNFVLNGDPNQGANVTGDQWLSMNSSSSFISINVTPKLKLNFREDVDAFWNVLVPRVLNDIHVPVVHCPSKSAAGQSKFVIGLLVLSFYLCFSVTY